VNNQLPTREQAIELLRKNHCSPQIINHCLAVADLSLEIATQLQKKGQTPDLKLVEAGALLHDIGRSKTNSVNHGVIGGKIAETEALPEPVIKIIKRHVGGGFTPEEAALFGWPPDVYAPSSLEEKIVSYADKLIDNSNRKRVPIDVEISKLQAKGHKDGAERVRKLHEEMTTLGAKQWRS
jgi:uncharacterized protein